MGKSEVKNKWTFQDVTGDRSLGVGFKKDVFIGKNQWEIDIEQEEREQEKKKMDKLAKRLKKLDEEERIEKETGVKVRKKVEVKEWAGGKGKRKIVG